MRRQAAVFCVFALNGFVLGTWAPRTPALSEQVGIGPGAFGLGLLGASVGMLLAALASGRVVERYGSRTVIAVAAVGMVAVLPLLGSARTLPWLAAALLGFGITSGVLDVAMNVAGLVVERARRRPVMPVLHAGYSFGALTGAGVASLAAWLGWSPLRHFSVAAIAGVALLAAVVRAAPGATTPDGRPAPADRGKATAPVRRPVLWLLAIVALCSAIAEGASSDWSALLLASEQGADEGSAALAYAGFALAMALTRLAGSWAQSRFGSGRVLVAGAVAAGAGLATAALVGVPGVSYAGFVLAGAGLAACFPVALGLAGQAGARDDDSGGEREVAFVTAVAYAGVFVGPPMIGGIAHLTSLSVSFVVVGLIAALIAPVAVAATRRLGPEHARHRTSAALR